MTPSQLATIQELLPRLHRHITTASQQNDVSLMGGKMGFALFEAYYNHHFGVEDDNQLWEYISDSLSKVQEGELIHSFASGIAGIAWTFLHLHNQGLLQDDELDAQGIVEGLDEGLFEISMAMLKEGDFDYLHGGLSAAMYFLERTPSPQIATYIAQLVEQLSAVAVRFDSGDITWKFLNFNSYDLTTARDYNLGLSHGTASITAILSLFYEQGYAPERCQELITGNLQWMWRVRNKACHSVFPNTVTDTPADQESRLAWCYGDLGIANTFWLAGEKLNQQAWKDIAAQTVRQAATRHDDDLRVNDAPLCHGAVGAAYLFQRFAERLQDPLLEAAATAWMQKGLDLALLPTQEDVFLTYRGIDGGYTSNLSVLDGEAGIGLAFLSALGGAKTWDRFLLIS
ncbi:MAG: lanthionine synthetase C family protein [Spirosomataceae bacterium]